MHVIILKKATSEAEKNIDQFVIIYKCYGQINE